MTKVYQLAITFDCHGGVDNPETGDFAAYYDAQVRYDAILAATKFSGCLMLDEASVTEWDWVYTAVGTKAQLEQFINFYMYDNDASQYMEAGEENREWLDTAVEFVGKHVLLADMMFCAQHTLEEMTDDWDTLAFTPTGGFAACGVEYAVSGDYEELVKFVTDTWAPINDGEDDSDVEFWLTQINANIPLDFKVLSFETIVKHNTLLAPGEGNDILCTGGTIDI